MTFEDRSTGEIDEHSWDLGDGTSFEYGNPISFLHEYEETGVYRVELTVRGPGGSDTEVELIRVATISLTPAPEWILFDEVVTFTATADGCGSASGWRWSFDGGEPVGPTDGSTVSVSWPTATGSGTKVVEVGNSSCGDRSAVERLNVRQPRVYIDGPRETESEVPTAFEASAEYCEPLPGEWNWKLFKGEIVAGAGTDRVTAVWPPSPFTTDNISVTNPGCVDGGELPFDSHIVLINVEEDEEGDPEAPRILGVTRELPGFFLENTKASNRFDVEVDWRGAPGQVRFSVDGSPVDSVPGDGEGAAYTFRMDGFEPSLAPSSVGIVAENSDGLESSEVVEKVYVFPHPAWLDDALEDGDGFLRSSIEEGEIVYRIEAEHPDPHLAADGPIDIPSWIPFLGGRFGLLETFVRVEGSASTTGIGDFDIQGQSGFAAAGGSVEGVVNGGGDFRFFEHDGLTLTSASFTLDIDSTIPREMKLLDAIPGIRRAENLEGVGSIIEEINSVATLSGTIRPELLLTASFRQNEHGELVFQEGGATLGLGLDAAITVPLDSLTLTARLGGHGEIEVGIPRPLVKRIDFWAEVGVSAEIDLLFTIEGEWAQRFGCTWKAGGVLDCGRRDTGALTAAVIGLDPNAAVRPIRHSYRRYGEVSRLTQRELSLRSGVGPASAERTELVRNVFPGASPRRVELDGGSMMIWEHQDSADPVHRSLEIAWSMEDGERWLEPALLNDDTRLELSPTAALDREGRLVAAWLRVSEPAYPGPILSLEDVADLHRHLEVVTATFDPVMRTWSEVTPLTDDDRVEKNLRLADDGEGTLLLTWLSSPDGASISSTKAPADLRFSFWRPSEGRWSDPATVAGAISGAVRHTAAVRADDASIVLERKDADGTRRLELYRWTGEGWSDGADLTGDAESDRAARLVYDPNGTAHATWLRNDSLVHSRLDELDPKVVLSEARSLGLLDARLLAHPEGHLVLLWPEVGDSGAAGAEMVVYDTARRSWSRPRTLVDDAGMLREPDAIFDRDGLLHLTFVDTEIERHDETVEIDGVPREIRGIPSGGRSDLHVVEYELGTNLTLQPDEAELDPRRPEPGEPTRVALVLRNTGDFEIGDATVEIYAGAPGPGGELLAETHVPVPLPGGASIPLEIDFTRPDAGGDLVAVADRTDRIDESSETDNRVVLYTTNEPPEPMATAKPATGEAPLTVRFDAGGSTDPEGGALSYRWSFGDGGAASGPEPVHTFRDPGRYAVTVLVSDGERARPAVVEVEVEEATAPPPPPEGEWLALPAVPGFEAKVLISGGAGELSGALEPDCIAETACVSGALPGRSEVFLRVVGPKPNGRLWPTIVKFTTSTVEVWLRQTSTGAVRHYELAGARPGVDELPGLFDRNGFEPQPASSPVSPAAIEPPPTGGPFTSDRFPDFRFWVQISSGGVSQDVRREEGCIEETLCFSGAIPGRSEIFLRIVGPKPNGNLWPTLVKFTTSEVEVWIEQLSTGVVRHYTMDGAAPGANDLTGLFDRDGFLP